jgi:hypothetical protein
MSSFGQNHTRTRAAVIHNQKPVATTQLLHNYKCCFFAENPICLTWVKAMGQFIKSTITTIALIALVVFALSNRDRILGTMQTGLDTFLATPDPAAKPKATDKPAQGKPATGTDSAATPVVAATAAQTAGAVATPETPVQTSAPQQPASIDPVPLARTNPAVLALEQADKNAHQALIEDLTAGFQSGKSQDELDQVQATYLDDALKRFGPFASGKAIVTLARTQDEFARTLQKGDPDLCWAFLSDNKAEAARVRAQLRADTAMQRKIDEAKATVLASASTTPSGYIAADKAPTLIRDAFSALQKIHGADVGLLANPTAPGDNSKRCQISLDLTEEILAMPEADAQDAMRFLISQAATAPQTPQTSDVQPAAKAAAPAVAVTDLEIQAIDEQLIKEPYFQALAAAEPDRYRDMVIQIIQSQKAGGSLTDIAAISETTSREMTLKYRLRASDDALVGYFRALTGVAEKLGARNPTACSALLGGGKFALNTAEQLPQADIRKMMAANTQLIKTGTGQEPKSFDTTASQSALNEAVKQLSPESASAFAQLSSGAQVDPSTGCTASLDFYKAVTKLPRARASSALRLLMANAPQQ